LWPRRSRLRSRGTIPGPEGGVLAAYATSRPGTFDHAVGEGKERAAPAAREPPRSAIGARHVPVPLTPHKEDDFPAPAARERQAPRYLYLAYAHRPPLYFLAFRYPPRA
jgi:hypothetical protein